MIKGQATFNFIDKRLGVTKDGEQYLVINCISSDNKNYNFITKNPDVIARISPLNIQRFAPVKLTLGFDKVFNNDKRISYWNCELIGVD